MKRLTVLLFFCTLLLCCCSSERQQMPETFYYPYTNYLQTQYGKVLGSESRETAGMHSVASVLDLYIKGPHSNAFANPFPSRCRIVDYLQTDSHLTLTISDEFAQLTGIELSMACVSLAQTCMEMTGVTNVTLRTETLLLDGDREITLTADSFLFIDAVSVTAPAE